MPRPRVMYIENKSARPRGQKGVVGPARKGRVTFSKTGKSLYYRGKTFQSLKGNGFKANYCDVDSGEQYWISGPKKNGADGLYGPRPTTYFSSSRITGDDKGLRGHRSCGVENSIYLVSFNP